VNFSVQLKKMQCS